MTTSSKQAVDTFTSTYGQPPEIVVLAPGRINLIGEHTDYNDGFVFPAAIDRGLTVALRRSDRPSKLHSKERGNSVSFDAATAEPGKVDGWAKYVAGMAWAMKQHTGQPMPNIEGVVSSDLPIGSGLSSSAAIELAFGFAWNLLTGLNLDRPTLAKLGQKDENEFIGLRSGIMDQMASACGKANYALFLDTRSLQIEPVPVPSDWVAVVCDTKKPRHLAGSAYNERRSQCEQAARVMGVKALRDANLEQLQEAALDPLIFRRAKHVITENNRCLAFRDALSAGNTTQAGELMRQSHESLRDDYEVSCTELDAMAEAAWQAPGCIGARMTGAGFGGACVALVHAQQAEVFKASVYNLYKAKMGTDPELISCALAEGVHQLNSAS